MFSYGYRLFWGIVGIVTLLSLVPPLVQAGSLTGSSFYTDPDTYAAHQAAAWRASRPSDAALLDTIANQPKAFWMGNWTPNSQQSAQDFTSRAAAVGKTGIIAAYNIPSRDCGSYSSGGSADYANYKSWIDGLAAGIGPRRTVVILEPDALAQVSCLNSQDGAARLDALSYAVTKLKSAAGALVYIDAGNKGWIGAADMANRLQQVNIAAADGFSLNVSNFYTAAETIPYGTDISNRLGGKHFIIDTSRSGNGSNGEWCNPSGRALGESPTTATGSSVVDAFLWIKGPGESDGTCNGGPSAGQWWPDYALGLASAAQAKSVHSAGGGSNPITAQQKSATSGQSTAATGTTAPGVAKQVLPSSSDLASTASKSAGSTAIAAATYSSRHVSGMLPLSSFSNSIDSVTLDKYAFSGTSINTRLLDNGKHELLIVTKDDSTITVSLTVDNRLNLWEKVRNWLAPYGRPNEAVANVRLITSTSLPFGSGVKRLHL